MLFLQLSVLAKIPAGYILRGMCHFISTHSISMLSHLYTPYIANWSLSIQAFMSILCSNLDMRWAVHFLMSPAQHLQQVTETPETFYEFKMLFKTQSIKRLMQYYNVLHTMLPRTGSMGMCEVMKIFESLHQLTIYSLKFIKEPF